MNLANSFLGVGMQIASPPELDTTLKNLGAGLETNYGAISYHLTGTNVHTGKITDITMTATFA